MSKAFMLYIGGKKLKNRVHVFVLYTTFRCLINDIYTSRVSMCSGVIWLFFCAKL